MVGIYKITSPSGKVYIGQSINIKRRFKEYNRKQCNQSIKLFNSLIKYGPEKHKFEIIEECEVERLNEREEYYISLFNSVNEGLNIKLSSKPSWTGKKRPEHSKLLKEKGSGFKYIRKEEHRLNMSNIMKRVWKDKKDIISNKIRINKIGKNTKSVICNETGLVYSSITKCSENMGISKGNICRFVKGTYPYSNIRGFTFSYFENLK
jgi:group I intron endonuclease